MHTLWHRTPGQVCPGGQCQGVLRSRRSVWAPDGLDIDKEMSAADRALNNQLICFFSVQLYSAAGRKLFVTSNCKIRLGYV